MRTETLTFQGSNGDLLAARIDRPDGPSRGMALFAHCFTCSKESLAAGRVAASLVESGYSVLRFDFTGLGESEGAFAETTFSHNVEDLLHAADLLRAKGEPPSLLVGHSLGGAAVLVAADGVPEARAVATLNAPAEPAHVTRLLEDDRERIEREGRGTVDIGGRPFEIERRFLEDIEAHKMDEAIAHLGRALLVLHAPRDQIVSIEAARHIFDAAKHPKSFISLDDADHLLADPADGAYAGRVLAAWAERYLPLVDEELPRPLADESGADVVVEETGRGRFLQEARVGRHRLLADEPKSVGGDDRGPSPYELLLASLGACTSMTLRMYAERKGWPLEKAEVHLSHEKVPADEAPVVGAGQPKVDHIVRTVHLEGDLDEERRARLLEIADRCPVHRTLHEPVWIETMLDEKG